MINRKGSIDLLVTFIPVLIIIIAVMGGFIALSVSASVFGSGDFLDVERVLASENDLEVLFEEIEVSGEEMRLVEAIASERILNGPFKTSFFESGQIQEIMKREKIGCVFYSWNSGGALGIEASPVDTYFYEIYEDGDISPNLGKDHTNSREEVYVPASIVLSFEESRGIVWEVLFYAGRCLDV